MQEIDGEIRSKLQLQQKLTFQSEELARAHTKIQDYFEEKSQSMRKTEADLQSEIRFRDTVHCVNHVGSHDYNRKYKSEGCTSQSMPEWRALHGERPRSLTNDCVPFFHSKCVQATLSGADE